MQSNNEIKLRAFVQFFGLSISAIARATNMSVPYISRILSQNGNHIAGSNTFWLALEKALGQLVQERKSQIFTVVPVDVSKAEILLKSA